MHVTAEDQSVGSDGPRTSAETLITAGTTLKWPILLCSLPIFILSFLLPIYAQRLGASAADIGGLFSAFAFVIILVRPLVGLAMDRFGRKCFFVAGLLCYVIAMAIFAMASDMVTLYLARFIQGIGAALTWLASYTIAAELAIAERRGEALGQVDGASDRGAFYGMAIAMLFLSWLPLRPGWNVLFLGYTVLAIIGVSLAWRYVPETQPGRSRYRAHGSASARSLYRILGIMGATKLSSVPISWPLWQVLGITFVTKASAALVSPLLLIFLQNQFTTDLWLLALAYIPAALVLGFLPARMGRLSDRVGRIPLIAVGLGWSGAVSFFLPGLPTLEWFMVCFACNAFGIVTATPAQKALVGDLTRRENWGKAYGLYTFASSLGSGVGPLLGGWLYDTVGHAIPFYVNGAFLLGCAVWSVFLHKPALVGRVTTPGAHPLAVTQNEQAEQTSIQSEV
jgi:MFS transporter, DHA1 family, multidrug resistance protein